MTLRKVRNLLVTSVLLTFHPHIVYAESGSATCDESFKAQDGTCYGRPLKEKYFYLAKDYTNLNHGSFGAVPKPVAQSQFDFFLQQEARPDTWFRQTYFSFVDESRAKVASLIHASIDDVVLVENASSAVNAILRSLGLLKRGDKVLRLSTAYGMVVETLDYLVKTAGIQVIVANVTFPMTDPKEMVEIVESVLQQHSDVKLCIFSHISSMPAVVEPLEELVHVVRSTAPSSLILVDGAHAPGQIQVNISDYGVDFYVGNCHKWLYAPKGTAFLWVSRTQQTDTLPEPTVISSSGKHNFTGRFSYTGTRDYTGFAALSSAFDFINFLGGTRQIHTYCHQLAVEAAHYLSNAWNTSLLVPKHMSGYMVNVILPSHDKNAVAYMQEQINNTYGIYLVCGSISSPTNNDSKQTDTYFTRLSAQVYLEMDDFRPLAALVPKLLKEGSSHHTAVSTAREE